MPPINVVFKLIDVSAQPVSRGNELSIVSLVLQASPLVQLVLLLLAGLSVASWAIIFLKSRQFKRATQESDDIWQELDAGPERLPELRDMVEDFVEAPEAALLASGYDEWVRHGGPSAGRHEMARVRNALNRAATRETLRLERYLNVLATTGSASPFIGLFGTVWGIMNTFRALGEAGSTSLGVVAPGIAEALVATAVGLAAAIPAVMAYNHFLRKVRIMEARMEAFITQFQDELPHQHAAAGGA